ncbi:MAG: protein kinase [Pyrinomonadaceae bacterium]|nr:protein kinase [Pyrinomonadaceae bacterium]
MTPERWRQVEEILQAAFDRPPQERASFLDEACAGDEDLKQETTSLIRAYDEAGDFIEQPAMALDARVLAGASLDLNLGRAVGPYKIVERLGAGGMGEVYLAQDTRLGRLVALKILPSYFVSDETRLHRFQREARAASALNHPNIFTIHEVGEFEEVHFIATEFIDGQTLRELIAKGELSLAEILDIAVQVANALSAAHAAGIVHRDIKPENIMRRDDRLVKILDFGIAKLTEQTGTEISGEAPTAIRVQTETGMIMGTVGYMSPEQARGLAVDGRTDIWSFGVVLYEMLARRMPFTGATRMDTLVAILEREPTPLAELWKDAPSESKQLQNIVSKTLRKERSERYQTVAELLADLKTVKQEHELAAILGGQSAPEQARAALDIQSREEQTGDTSSATASSTALSTPSTPSVAHQLFHVRRGILALLVVGALIVAAMTVALLYRRSNARHAASTQGVLPANLTTTKLYSQMSEAERLAFIDREEQRISAMMGDRPVKLNEDALRAIKSHVDDYAARTGSISDAPGEEDLRVIYTRPLPYLPLIARNFTARKVPVIIGVYLPMIESEYKTCFENGNGAKGMFQFMPKTAKLYGVAHEEMCDVEKMTPAAANYIADRMAELGDDSESMTLVLLSYNRGAPWVRDALRQLRTTDNYERNFWTLLAHRDKFDGIFNDENARYVPRFFAAAIIGENPQTFELQTAPLSSLISKQ